MSKFLVGWDDLADAPKEEVASPEQLTKIWDYIQKRCKPAPTDQSSQIGNSNTQLVLPSLKKNLQNSREHKDLVIVYSQQSGTQLAKLMLEKLLSRGLTAVLSPNTNEIFNPDEIEATVANSTGMVVLLTAGCMKHAEVVFGMEAAKHYYRHPSLVILVHDAGSCTFPTDAPGSLQLFFSEKAVTLLQWVDQIEEKYQEEKTALSNILSNTQEAATAAFAKFIAAYEGTESLTIDQITAVLGEVFPGEQLQELIADADKNHDGQIDMGEFCSLILNSPKLAQKLADKKDDHDETPAEDIRTRLFLSHKRTTGQAIAGRLYEGLKEDYKIFLDSEAKFKIHNLHQIVQNTSTLVFILSNGIFQSRWCLEELKSAYHNKKQIVVLRDLSFQMPGSLPAEWKEVEHVIKNQEELIWMAEYNQACLEALKKIIGPPDDMLRYVDQTLEYRPDFLPILQKEKCLSVDRSSAMTGVYPLWWKFHDEYEITRVESLNSDLTGLEARVDWSNIQEAHLKLHPSYLEPVAKLAKHCLTKISFYNCWGVSGKLDCIYTYLPKLKHLNLSFTDATEEDLQIIFKLKYLEELYLSSTAVGDDFLEKFEGFPELRELDLSYPKGTISDNGIIAVAKGCPNLRKIFLLNASITDATFKALGESCHLLEELSICEFQTNGEGLAPIGRGCPNLETLSLQSHGTSIPTLSDLAEGCTRLTALRLSGCNSLGLKKPAPFPSLPELTLNTCTLDEEDYNNLFYCMPKLLSLDVSEGLNLSDASLEALAKAAPELKTFSGRLGEKVTDVGLKALATLKSLVCLNLYGAPSITLDGVMAFTEKDNISLSIYSQAIPQEEMEKVNRAISEKRRKANEEAEAKLANMTDEELAQLWAEAFAKEAQNKN